MVFNTLSKIIGKILCILGIHDYVVCDIYDKDIVPFRRVCTRCKRTQVNFAVRDIDTHRVMDNWKFVTSKFKLYNDRY